MRLTIVPIDNVVTINGVTKTVDTGLPSNVHAVQWYDGKGKVEYTDQEAKYIDTIEPFIDIVDAFNALPVPDEYLPEEPKTYDALRRAEYPSVGDQLDAIWKIIDQFLGIDGIENTDAKSMLGTIKDVKAKYPKPTEERN